MLLKQKLGGIFHFFNRQVLPLSEDKMVYRWLGPLIGLLFTAVGACDSTSRSPVAWTGSVEDSGGVRIVRNPEVGLWNSADRWSVREEIRIGSELDSAYQFGNIVSMDVASNGTIYVLDQAAQHVKVFDSVGSYSRTLGRPGSGPGEFSRNYVSIAGHFA